MKLLITGATGFIGRNLLLHALVSRRYSRIVASARDPEKLRRLLVEDGFPEAPSKVEILPWPIARPLRDVDHAVHSAGVLFGRSKREYFEGNISGTLDMLSKLSPKCRVVILSSQSAGGPTPPEHEARTEDDVDTPITWYGESKLHMEHHVVTQFGARFAALVVLRPAMVIGPRDRATLPLFRLARSPIRLKPGLFPKAYSWVSVDDLIEAIMTVLNATSHNFARKVYYLASPSSVSDVGLILEAGRVMGRRGFIVPFPQSLLRIASAIVDRSERLQADFPSLMGSRVAEIMRDRWVVDGSAFSAEIAWGAKTDLSTILATTCQWYIDSGQLPIDSRTLQSPIRSRRVGSAR